MTVEGDVQFLNIDLLLVGRFDRKPLLAAMANSVFALHDDADDAKLDNEPLFAVEVLGPDLDFAKTLSRLVEWVQGLPPAARRSWAAASRRIFDIGIQAGRKPHELHWTIRPDQVAALARLGAEIALTVYGAEASRAPPTPSRRRSGPVVAQQRPRRNARRRTRGDG